MAKETNAQISIRQCANLDCRSDTYRGAAYQDARYGKNMRVHNGYKTPNGTQLWRCTICGRSNLPKGGRAGQRRNAQLYANKMNFQTYHMKLRKLPKPKRGLEAV